MGRLRPGAGAVAAATAVGAWATWVEPRRLVVRRRTIAPPRWPAALDGLRVALLSDFHAGGPHVQPDRVRDVARRVQRTRPDLALLLGDFIDDEVAGARELDPRDVAEALAPLRPPLGRVAVLGNHDWSYGGARVRAGLEQEGIRVLENESLRAGDLWLAGLADLRMRAPDVDAALADIPVGAPALALLHDPDLFPRIPARVALSVAGHTHGGQVRLPLLGPRFIPSRFGTRYLHGLVEEDRRLLYVTSGVGQAGWPVRLRTPPEAVLLTLRGTA